MPLPYHHPWAFERGTLWARECNGNGAVLVAPKIRATLGEVYSEAAGELATAMGFADSAQALRRFSDGRRCFVARVDGSIATYGWVSRGVERIGELERTLHMTHRRGVYLGLRDAASLSRPAPVLRPVEPYRRDVMPRWRSTPVDRRRARQHTLDSRIRRRRFPAGSAADVPAAPGRSPSPDCGRPNRTARTRRARERSVGRFHSCESGKTGI